MEMGKTIWQSIISEKIGFVQFGEFVLPARREKHIIGKSKNKRKTEILKTIFLSNKITATCIPPK